MASAVTKIEQLTPSGSTSTAFNSIPGTYDDLMIIGSSKNTETASDSSTRQRISLRINSDTGSNYAWSLIGAQSASSLSNGGLSESQIWVYGNSSSHGSNVGWGHFWIYFAGYKVTNAYKAINMAGGYTQETSAASDQSGWTGNAEWCWELV